LSRLIKQYPYNEKFKDEISEHADSIKDYELPDLYISYVHFQTDGSIHDADLNLLSSNWAEEETKGVHIKAELPTTICVAGLNSSSEIVVDEEAFCDAVLKCAMDETNLESNDFIKESMRALGKKYQEENVTRDIYFRHHDYNGVGAIVAGASPVVIGLFNTLCFDTKEIVLKKYIGTTELSDMENVKVVFFADGYPVSFEIERLNLSEAANDGDLLTLTLTRGTSTKCTTDVRLPHGLEELTPYDFETGSEQEYYAQRNDLLNRLDEEANSSAPNVDDMVNLLFDNSL